MKKTLLTLAIGALMVIAGVGSGIYLRMSTAGRRQTELSPQLVEFAKDPVEGSRVTVPLQFHNQSAGDVVIDGASGSCGCMEIVTHGGREFSSPITVKAGERIPVEVTISTAGRVGKHQFQVALHARSGSQAWDLTSVIKMQVRSGWRTRPRQLVFSDVVPGQKVEADIDVFDSHDDPGIAIKQLATTDPRVKVELIEAGDLMDDDADPFDLQDMRLKHRYRLHVQYVVPDRRALVADEAVILQSRESDRRLKIPIVCHIQPPAYRLSPLALLLPGESTDFAAFRRKIRCELGPGASGDLRVLQAPAFLKVTIERERPQTLTIVVRGKTGQPVRVGKDDAIVFGTKGSDAAAFTIPVLSNRFISGKQIGVLAN